MESREVLEGKLDVLNNVIHTQTLIINGHKAMRQQIIRDLNTLPIIDLNIDTDKSNDEEVVAYTVSGVYHGTTVRTVFKKDTYDEVMRLLKSGQVIINPVVEMNGTYRLWEICERSID